jgi:hypothetical protein
MKFVRPLVFGLGALIILVLVAVLLAFTPAVQTWAVRRVLEQQPGIEAEVGRVAAGLNTVCLEDVRLRFAGTEWILPSVEIDFPVVSAVLGGRVEVTRVLAKGWTLDLVGASPAAGPAAPRAPAQAGYLAFLSAAHAQAPLPVAAFDGIFSRLALPVDLSVSGVNVEGEIRFARAADQTPAVARIALTGGGLSPGATGRFVLSTEIRVDDPASPIDRVVARQEISLRMDAPRSIDRIEVTGAATATGPQFPNGVRVDMDTSAARLASGESYGFTLRSGRRVLFGAQGELPAGGAALTGQWSLDARSADLSPFALGRPIPEFAADGSGRFALDRAFAEIQAAGRIKATTRNLQALDPRLRAVGALELAVDFDLVSRDADVRLSRLHLDVSAERPVLGVTLLQGVEFSRATGELRVADIASDLLRVQLKGVPLAWAQPVLGDTVVTGDDLRGGFVANVRSGRLVLRPTDPLSVQGLTVAQAGQGWIEAVDFSAQATLDYAPTGWQADVASLSFRRDGRSLAEITLKAARAGGSDQAVNVRGTYALDLAALVEQPAFIAFGTLQSGQAEGDFSASLAAVQRLAAKLLLRDLAVAEGPSLPEILVEIRADRLADGTVKAQVPMSFTRNGRVSDLTLAAALEPTATGHGLEAVLTGTEVFLQDVQILAVLVGSDEASAQAVAPLRNPMAPWAGLTGRIAVDLKKVVYSPSLTINGVVGSLLIGPNALTFEHLSAGLPGGAGLRASGDLAYDPRRSRAYGLTADFTLSNFDPVPLFRAINPTALPPIEGRFDLASKITGEAAELGGLSAGSTGTFKLSSRGGVLRALSVDASEFSRIGSRIASVAGLIGLATGDTRALKYSDRLKAANELAQQLAAVTFDQLTVDLESGPGNDLVIHDLSLISPTIRLLGNGRIQHQPGVALWSQPLSLQLQLGAREKLAENLRTLKLTGEIADNLGYTPLLENLQIDGSLSSLGATMLRDRLIQALAGQ